MNTANALKQYRAKRKMTQQDLADALGVSLGYIGSIECGRRQPSAAMAKRWHEMTRGRLNKRVVLPEIFA